MLDRITLVTVCSLILLFAQALMAESTFDLDIPNYVIKPADFFVYKLNTQSNNENSNIRPIVEPPPPLSKPRLLGQIAAGTIGGGIGYAGGTVLGALISDCSSSDESFCGLGETIIAGATGWMLGTTTGIFFGGKKKGINASIPWTYLGVVLGGMGALFILDNNELSSDYLDAIVGLTLPSIGGVIAFNTTRRYETKIRPASPSRKPSMLFVPRLQYNTTNQKQEMIASVKFLDLDF